MDTYPVLILVTHRGWTMYPTICDNRGPASE